MFWAFLLDVLLLPRLLVTHTQRPAPPPHCGGGLANLHYFGKFEIFPQIKIIPDYRICQILEFLVWEVQLYMIFSLSFLCT